MAKIQVYCAISLDGFIAGPNDDLSWLHDPDAELGFDEGTIGFEAFLAQTGAMLMGRRTYDVVQGFGVPWPYGELPVLVATHRELEGGPTTVLPCSGDIEALCAEARAAAGERNVYLDGGNLVSQALAADLVDELILTVAPVFLGAGVPLYQGTLLRRFSATCLGSYGGMPQLRLMRGGSA